MAHHRSGGDPLTPPSSRLYRDLAQWWPLLSPPGEYDDEAADLLRRLDATPDEPRRTLLELGSGGGSLSFHLKPSFRLTLSDLSPGMLAVSRALNPECEHHLGDMRTLRLGREFDVVLIHDAIMYATDPDSARQAIATAAVHCRPGGTVVVMPDFIRETFRPGTDCGGHDADDGRGLRYLEWSWDPDPADHTFLTEYAFLLRGEGGAVEVVHDRHVEGLFSRAEWLEWFAEAGLSARSSPDPWGREIFQATRAGTLPDGPGPA